ncbi:thioether cross-link-forming SCIFF peptide maturase, partial [Bacillus cereus]|nr:thioether cross-link-forming SCIFF peptide maturase [Bacillus cereus]
MIHQYQLNGYNIVLDTYSGSVHVVDELAYDIIALYDQASPDEILSFMQEKYEYDPAISEESIRGTIAEVEELRSQGQLFTKDPYE